MTILLKEKGETAARVAHALSPAIINLTALSVDFKQLHWHVRGDNFISVHKLLDEIIEHARDATDVLAERVVAIGATVDGRIANIASNASTPAIPEGFINSDLVIDCAVAQIDAVLVAIYEAIEDLADPVSQDIVIEIAKTFEKDRWFLLAHKAA